MLRLTSVAEAEKKRFGPHRIRGLRSTTVNTMTESYTDIDIYGRGLDTVFGKGAETYTKANALLELKTRRDRKMRGNAEYVDYDLYGRADPRIFGHDAHKINLESAAAASRTTNQRSPNKKSLRAIFFPFVRARKTNGFLRDKLGRKSPKDTLDQHLEPLDDSPHNVALDRTFKNITPSGLVTPVDENTTKKLVEAHPAGAVEKVMDDNEKGLGSRQETADFDDCGIASVAEVSSPEASDVPSKSTSSSDEVPKSNFFLKMLSKRRSAGKVSGINGNKAMVLKDQSSRPMPIAVTEQYESDTVKAMSRPVATGQSGTDSSSVVDASSNEDSGSVSFPVEPKAVLASESSLLEASTGPSSIDIDAVKVSDAGYVSESNSSGSQSSVQDGGSSNSGSFSMARNIQQEGTTLDNGPFIEEKDLTNSGGSPFENLFQTGSLHSSESGAGTPKQAAYPEKTNADGCERENVIAHAPIHKSAQGGLDAFQTKDEREREHLSVECDELSGTNTQSEAKPVNVIPDQSESELYPVISDVGLDIAASVRRIDSEDEDMDTNQESQNSGHLVDKGDGSSSESSDDEFVDALDEITDSDGTKLAESSSPVESSSLYTTGEDSDDMPFAENTSASPSGSQNGKIGSSKLGSSSNESTVERQSSASAGDGTESTETATEDPMQAGLDSEAESGGVTSQESSEVYENTTGSSEVESSTAEEGDNSDDALEEGNNSDDALILDVNTTYEIPEL